jgi:hypothetical protein
MNHPVRFNAIESGAGTNPPDFNATAKAESSTTPPRATLTE